MKFGDALSAQLTPEWRSQYIKYDVRQILIEETIIILSKNSGS